MLSWTAVFSGGAIQATTRIVITEPDDDEALRVTPLAGTATSY